MFSPKPAFTEDERFQRLMYLEERGVIDDWTSSDPGEGRRWVIMGRFGDVLVTEEHIDYWLHGATVVAQQIRDAVIVSILRGKREAVGE